MFEHRKEPVVPHHVFLWRFLRSLGFCALIILTSLSLGTLGYHFIEGLPWIDAYLEAAMISAGMGPSTTIHTTAGKLFAGTYAIYCGLVLIVTIGIGFAPIVHRFFHKFHVDTENDAPQKKHKK